MTIERKLNDNREVELRHVELGFSLVFTFDEYMTMRDNGLGDGEILTGTIFEYIGEAYKDRIMVEQPNNVDAIRYALKAINLDFERKGVV